VLLRLHMDVTRPNIVNIVPLPADCIYLQISLYYLAAQGQRHAPRWSARLLGPCACEMCYCITALSAPFLLLLPYDSHMGGIVIGIMEEQVLWYATCVIMVIEMTGMKKKNHVFPDLICEKMSLSMLICNLVITANATRLSGWRVMDLCLLRAHRHVHVRCLHRSLSITAEDFHYLVLLITRFFGCIDRHLIWLWQKMYH